MPGPREPDIADDVREWLMIRLPEAGIDSDAARVLAGELEGWIRCRYGTERHYVRAPGRVPARVAIQQDWRAGYTVRQIAERHGVTVQYVYRVIRDDRPSLGRREWEERR